MTLFLRVNFFLISCTDIQLHGATTGATKGEFVPFLIFFLQIYFGCLSRHLEISPMHFF